MKLPEPVAWMVTAEMQDGSHSTFPLNGRYKDVCDTCDFGDPVPLYTETQLREALAQQEAENEANERNLCQLTDELAESRREVAQLQEQNNALDAKLALYERIRQKPDQVVEEIMGLAFKMAGMIQHVKHAPDGKERRHQAVDDLEQAVTNLDNIASELQNTCDRQAMRLASNEAVMRMALEALNCSELDEKRYLAIAALEEQLK